MTEWKSAHMGYNTDLIVGERLLGSWRKQASELPRLLFDSDDAVVEPCQDEDDESYPVIVELRASAAQVLKTLEQNGLGWNATIAAYSQLRSGVFAEALMSGMKSGELTHNNPNLAGDELEAAVEKAVAAEARSSPRQDLETLGRLLADQWTDDGVSEVLFLEEVGSEGPLDFSSSLLLAGMSAAEARASNGFQVARALETLGALYSAAPLLCWPMTISVLLRHLSPDTQVVYDLSGDAHESGCDTVDEARVYFDRYWINAAEGIGEYSEKLGVLFGALAAFDNKLGPNFWFGRASTLLARLQAVATSDDQVSNKARGDALEDLVDAIVRTEQPHLSVLEKNYKTKEEEIDLVLTNNLPDPFWMNQHSALIFLECKNHKEPIGVQDLRVFESKMKDRGALVRIGIFVSMSGFTAPFFERLKSIQAQNGIIFPVDGQDLTRLISDKRRLSGWLREEGLKKALGKNSQT